MKKTGINEYIFGLPVSDDIKFTLRGRVHLSDQYAPIIIIVPGFLGFVGWGFYPFLAKALFEKGFTVVAFNHSTGGVGDKWIPYSDLKSLEYWTIERDIRDIGIIISAMESGEIINDMPLEIEQLGLVGHSKGTAVSALFSLRNSRVKTIVSINGISRFQRVDEDKIEDIIQRGYFEKQLPGTLMKVRIKKDLWQEFASDPAKYDVIGGIKKSGLQNLIIQGSLDDKVSIEEARELHEASGAGSKLVIIENADHNLNWTHIIKKPDLMARKVIALIVNWFSERFDFNRE